MKVSSIQNYKALISRPQIAGKKPAAPVYNNFESGALNFENYRNYFPNINQTFLSFEGACERLRKMTAFAPDGSGYSLKKGTDGSYLVDPETVTRIYYGKDATKLLNKKTVFENKTQVICPNDGELLIEADGKKIPLESDGAVVIDSGREVKISVVKGNPLIITSERKPVWYEEYCNNPKNKTHIETVNKLNKVYRHIYSGHIKVANLTDDIVSKLVEAGKAEVDDDNQFIKMKHFYHPDFMERDLEGVLTKEEFAAFRPHYARARNAKVTCLEARKVHGEELEVELRQKLIEKGAMLDLSKGNGSDTRLYWRELYASETELNSALQNMGFSEKERKEIVRFWKSTNKLNFDCTGLKYLSDGLAVFSLKDRVNNMTGGSQHWLTSSYVLSSKDEHATSPFIGVSEKHSARKYDEPVLYKQIRSAENLHSHPAEIGRHQTEVYIITEGAGALTVIENNKPKTIVLKQGEGLVLQPGVRHCVSAFKGKYEHFVCQIPSAFHYGTSFKIDHSYPEGYSENGALEAALKKLEKVKV